MVIYSFITDNGEEIERSFPMGDCPSVIQLTDGQVAKRTFKNAGFVFKGGNLPPGASMKRKEEITKRNVSAGDRGREYWKSRNPKGMF